MTSTPLVTQSHTALETVLFTVYQGVGSLGFLPEKAIDFAFRSNWMLEVSNGGGSRG
jgi:hypothetical protein